MRKPYFLRACALLLSVTLALAGCGGTSAPASNAPASEVVSASASTPEAPAGQPAGKPVVWKFATNLLEDTEWAAAMVEMFDRWNKETNGEVTVEVYWQSSLGAEADVLQNLQTGNVELAHLSFVMLAQFEEAFNVVDLPFLFEDREHFERYILSPEAQTLMAKFKDHGIWFNYCGLLGYRYPNLTKKQITGMDDFKGMTFRTMDSLAQMATIEQLGGTAIIVPYTDVYNALNTGVCDAWTCDLLGIRQRSTYEVAPYITGINMFPCVTGMIISQKALDDLSPSAAETVKRIYTEMMPDIMKTAWDENIAIIDWLKTEGGIKDYHEVTDLAPFVEAVQPVWKELSDRYDGVAEQIEVARSLQ